MPIYFDKALPPNVKSPKMVTKFIVHVARVTLVKNAKLAHTATMVHQRLKAKSVNRANVRAILIQKKKAHAIRSVVNV